MAANFLHGTSDFAERIHYPERFRRIPGTFQTVIQLKATWSIVLFFHKLNPFSPRKTEGEKKQTWQLWFKVIAAIIPSGIVGVLFDDWMEAHFHNATVVSIALIVYGVAFILVERRNARRVGGKTVEDVRHRL